MKRNQDISKSSGDPSEKAKALADLKAGQLESAFNKITAFDVKLDATDYNEVIAHLKQKAEQAFAGEQIRPGKRYGRIPDKRISVE
jgi:hypothetical protein